MFTQILVPLDGSELAEKALPHAQGLAKTYGAAIHLLRVFPHHPSGGSPHSQGEGLKKTDSLEYATAGYLGSGRETGRGDSVTLELARQVTEAQIEQAQEYLEQIAAQLRKEGIQTCTGLHEGPIHNHIVEYARENSIDIIVMSTHGYGGLKRLLVGSTTDRVIRLAEVPVLVVP